MLKRNIANKEKTILYLDTRELPCERQAELRAALDQGYQLVVATPNPSAYQAYNVDYVIDTPVGDFDVAEKDILAFLNNKNIQVNGILVWKDREVILSARLCEKLNLPGTSLIAAENVRNKAKTREVLDRIPGVNPKYAVVTNEQSFLTGLEKVGVPCLLKQAGNSGSRGMKRITSIDEGVSAYLEFKTYNASQTGEMFHYFDDVALLEQEVVGTEHSAAGVVADGKVITFGIADKLFDRSLPLQYQNTVPSKMSAEQRVLVVETVQKAVALTGINWCGFHVDFMMTDDGIKILEIGGRLGGEMINSHLIPLAQPGLKPYDILIDVVQGINPLTEVDYTNNFKGAAGSRAVMPASTGTIQSISGVENVRKNPHCREFMQLYGVGSEMVLPEVKFKAYEIGYILAECAADEDIKNVMQQLDSLITIELDNN